MNLKFVIHFMNTRELIKGRNFSVVFLGLKFDYLI